jgi:hypothetical protein
LYKTLKGETMGVNEKIKKRREGFNPNIDGDPALNVRTDEEGTDKVPTTKQHDPDPKHKDKRDPSEESGAKN